MLDYQDWAKLDYHIDKLGQSIRYKYKLCDKQICYPIE